jgi:hypothetical protein
MNVLLYPFGFAIFCHRHSSKESFGPSSLTRENRSKKQWC